MTAPHPTPAPLAAVAAPDTDVLAQVATTLQFVKEQLQLCAQAMSQQHGKIGTMKFSQLERELFDAKHDVIFVLRYITDNGVTPAPQAPEVPRRVRVVKASSPYCWYANRIGDEFEVIQASDRDYAVSEVGIRTGWLILISDCEPVSVPTPALSAREAALVEAARDFTKVAHYPTSWNNACTFCGEKAWITGHLSDCEYARKGVKLADAIAAYAPETGERAREIRKRRRGLTMYTKRYTIIYMSNNKQTTIRIDPEWQAAIDTLKERFAIPKATTVLRMATFLTLNDGYRYMPDYEIRRAAGERDGGQG